VFAYSTTHMVASKGLTVVVSSKGVVDVKPTTACTQHSAYHTSDKLVINAHPTIPPSKNKYELTVVITQYMPVTIFGQGLYAEALLK
jgi:hypothetical protein